MNALCMGQLVSLTYIHACMQMLDPVHNRGLRLCHGAVITSPVFESLYVDAHEPCLGARRAKLSLQYAV